MRLVVLPDAFNRVAIAGEASWYSSSLCEGSPSARAEGAIQGNTVPKAGFKASSREARDAFAEIDIPGHRIGT